MLRRKAFTIPGGVKSIGSCVISIESWPSGNPGEATSAWGGASGIRGRANSIPVGPSGIPGGASGKAGDVFSIGSRAGSNWGGSSGSVGGRMGNEKRGAEGGHAASGLRAASPFHGETVPAPSQTQPGFHGINPESGQGQVLPEICHLPNFLWRPPEPRQRLNVVRRQPRAG